MGENVLADLMDSWHEQRRRGREPTPEELCTGHPELLAEVRRRVEALRAVEEFVGISEEQAATTDGAPSTGGDAAPGSASEEADAEAPDQPREVDFLGPPAGPGEVGRLGPFRVLRVLGRGGMGVVWEAEDGRLRRRVALKVMRPELAARPEARARFLREARAMAALEHDHVVPILQVDEVAIPGKGTVPFLTMPLLRGLFKDRPPVRLLEIPLTPAPEADGHERPQQAAAAEARTR